jgi:peptidoglycan/xylan/chitin deacetylase (PgdA/CDA1 family)
MFDVTLTFDNGPEPEVTPTVLETLRRSGIKATFFVLGVKLAMPERRWLAEQTADEGHWIGNHTFTHSVPLGASSDPQAPEAEIGRTEALIGPLARPERLFRPFGGGGNLGTHLLSPAALAYLKAGAFTCVLWNCVPKDWLDPEGWVDRALEDCGTRPWSLVVVHDLPTGAMAHLERFIAGVHRAGGRFRQDFPPDCVPLRRGRETAPIAPYVAM